MKKNNIQHKISTFSKKMFIGLYTASVLAVTFGLFSLAFADSNNSSSAGSADGFKNPIEAESLDKFLESLLKVITTIGAIVVVIFLILAGFKYVTARGDSKKIEEATKTLTWTVVGAMVLLGAQVIATAIKGTINELQ